MTPATHRPAAIRNDEELDTLVAAAGRTVTRPYVLRVQVVVASLPTRLVSMEVRDGTNV
jgi:hypothetical protein